MATRFKEDQGVDAQAPESNDPETPAVDQHTPGSLDATIPPTRRHDMLFRAGASLHVLSHDVDLLSAVETGADGDYPVEALAEWVDLVELLEDGMGRILLLDADHARSDVRKRVAQIRQLAEDPIILVATTRDRARDLIAFMADRSIHRVLIKPAHPGMVRLLLESAVSRYFELHAEHVSREISTETEPVDKDRADAETAARTAAGTAFAAADAADDVAMDSEAGTDAGSAPKAVDAGTPEDVTKLSPDPANHADTIAPEAGAEELKDADSISPAAPNLSSADALREKVRQRTEALRTVSPVRGVAVAAGMAMVIALIAVTVMRLVPLGQQSDGVPAETDSIRETAGEAERFSEVAGRPSTEDGSIADLRAPVLQSGAALAGGSRSSAGDREPETRTIGLPADQLLRDIEPVGAEASSDRQLAVEDSELQASQAATEVESATPAAPGSADAILVALAPVDAVAAESEPVDSASAAAAADTAIAVTRSPGVADTDANDDIAPSVEADPGLPPSTTEPRVAADSTLEASSGSLDFDEFLLLARARLDAGMLHLPSDNSAAYYLLLAEVIDPENADLLDLRAELSTALVEEARTALDAADLDAASGLLDQALALAGETEALVALQSELSSALEARSAREQGEIFALAEQRFAEGQLVDPPGDNALAHIRRLATLNPQYEGLASLRARVVGGISDGVSDLIASSDWESAETALALLTDAGGLPELISSLRADLAAGRLQQTYLRIPAEAGELVLRSAAPVEYPTIAQRRNIEGWVELEFVVDSGGAPTRVRVIQADPEGWFEEAAIEALAAYRFEPFERDGRVYARLARLRVRFGLE